MLGLVVMLGQALAGGFPVKERVALERSEVAGTWEPLRAHMEAVKATEGWFVPPLSVEAPVSVSTELDPLLSISAYVPLPAASEMAEPRTDEGGLANTAYSEEKHCSNLKMEQTDAGIQAIYFSVHTETMGGGTEQEGWEECVLKYRPGGFLEQAYCHTRLTTDGLTHRTREVLFLFHWSPEGLLEGYTETWQQYQEEEHSGFVGSSAGRISRRL